MIKSVLKYIFAFLILGIVVLYLFPVPQKDLQELYNGEPQSLKGIEDYRSSKPSHLKHQRHNWEYLKKGSGAETILFLHGMGGSYDIWWQQIEALQHDYQVISLTYPPIATLSGMADGALAILDEENIKKVHVVGTSLGGAFAQYLAAYHPDRLLSATFGNTFVPNVEFYNLAQPQFKSLPYIPASMLMSVFRKGVEEQHYPPSDNSEILRAYLLEQGYGKMSKAQFVSRSKCVLDIFEKRALADLPIFIIESENDQLVPPPARKALKDEYPQASVYTFKGMAGHFSYINRPDEYVAVLKSNYGSLVK